MGFLPILRQGRRGAIQESERVFEFELPRDG